MRRIIFLLGTTLCVVAAVSARPVSSLDEYTGKYVFSNGNAGSEAVVEVQGDVLHIESKLGKATLTAVNKDVFNMVEYEGTAEFKRNDAGKVTHIKVRFGGMDVEGVKDIYAIYWWRHNMLFKKCLNTNVNN